MRSLHEAIACRNTPLAPGCNSRGRLLVDLDSHQCRFPIDEDAEAIRFCAVEVSPGDWQPGKSGGSYCRFHRVMIFQPREARAA